jgi:hypothetical protein
VSDGSGRRIDALLRRVSRLEQPAPAVITPLDAPDILAAMTDPELFGREFGGPSWAPWRAFLGAFFGLPLDDEQRAIYRAHTGRTKPPMAPSREAWVIAGRRAGKSRVAALVATYLAGFRDYSSVLAAGERGVVMVLAADTRQARIVQDYVRGLLERVPALRRLVRRWRLEAVELANGVTVEIHAASYRGVRGYSLIGVVADEVAFWRSDEGSANYDREVIDALRPGLLTTGGPLLAITTAYARRGEAWRHFDEHFGRAGDPVLVWKAPTVDMNPTVDAALIEEARARDPVSASAEYDSEFRRDLETFVAPEVVAAAIVPGRRELPYRRGVRYVAFADPSGGAADSYALAIAHEEAGGAVLDVVREIRAPFSPDAATAEYAALLRAYGLPAVTGDYYSAEWVVDRFRAHGITYERSARFKSDLYGELLGPLNSGRIRLLDVPALRAQLLSLERRTSRGGRDSIDHPPRGRDDVANAAAGALVEALQPSERCSIGGFQFQL